MTQEIRVGFLTSPQLMSGCEEGDWDSLKRLRFTTLDALKKNFPVEIMFNSNKEYFVENNKIDICYSNDNVLFARSREKTIPAIYVAQGHMPTGAYFLFKYIRSFLNIDSLLFSCTADFNIYNMIVNPRNDRMAGKLIPYGVEDKFFTTISEEEKILLKRKYNLPENKNILLYTGRINIQKNLHTLVKILASVKHYHNDVHLVIIGKEDKEDYAEFKIANQGYENYLRKVIELEGLNEDISIINEINDSDLVAFYCMADIFVNFTIHRDENFGLSQVEAMAAGTPVIASSWGGIKDTVIHGHTGFLVDTVISNYGIKVLWPRAVDYIVDLLKNSAKLEYFSQNAKKHAKQNYSLDVFSENIRNAVIETYNTQFTKKPELSISRIHTINPFVLDYYGECRKEEEYLDEQYKKTGNELLQEFKNYDYLIFKVIGDSYEWFRLFITPYSSQDIIRISENNIPYYLNNVAFAGFIFKLLDPIWPQNIRIVEPWKFEFLKKIGTNKPIDIICDELKRMFRIVDIDKVMLYAQHLLNEGVIWVK